jgi:hypothetical protein
MYTFTLDPQMQCPAANVLFTWDDVNTPLGNSQIDPQHLPCAASILDVTPPAGHDGVGQHSVCGTTDQSQLMPQACRPFTIDPPTPTATRTRTVTPEPTATTPPSPPPAPTATMMPTEGTTASVPSATPRAGSAVPASSTAAPTGAAASPPAGCAGASPPGTTPTPRPGGCDAPSDLVLGLCPTPVLQAGGDDSGGTHGGGGMRGVAFPISIILGGVFGLMVAGATLYPAGAGRRGILLAVGATVAGAAGAWAIAGMPLPDLGGTASKTVRLDDPRITQGLEYDADAGVDYLLIADKDTLVRATLTHEREITAASCEIRQFARLEAGFPVKLVAVTKPALSVAAGITSRFVVTSTDPTSDAVSRVSQSDCWLAGTDVPEPGYYQVQLDVTVKGTKKPQTFDLGAKLFVPTGDVRLLVYPMTWPTDRSFTNSELHPWTFGCTAACPKTDPRPAYAPWDGAAEAAMIDIIKEFQRAMPLRQGVGGVDFIGLGTHDATTPGMRFVIVPGVYVCPGRIAFNEGHDPELACKAAARANAEFWINMLNADLKKSDERDGHHRDRIDLGVAAVVNGPGSTGGQSCWGDVGPRVMGVEIDTRPSSVGGSVLIQELAHCLGEVQGDSPHSLKGNPRHSENYYFPLYNGLPGVDMRSREDVEKPASALNAAVGPSATNFLEGWEWNSLRRTLVGMTRPDPVSSTYKLSAPLPQTPLYVLTGLLDRSDTLDVDYSARVDDLLLDQTAAAGDSPYALVFVDAAGAEMGRFPFKPNFETLHRGDQPASATGLFLVAPLPDGSARVEVRHDNIVLYARTFNTKPPSIHNVQASPAADGHVLLRWEASHPDAAPLSYNVYFLATADAAPTLLASGLKETSFDFGTGIAPATSDARLMVEVSDGYHTARATSAAFSIAARPPIVSISAPRANDPSVFAGAPIVLEGTSYDFTAGMLAGDALHWHSDRDGDLGSGDRLLTGLSEGMHTLTLTAIALSGLSASATVQVTVRPASERPEVSATAPLADTLGISTDHIDLGRCSAGRTAQVDVRPTDAQVTWRARTDSSWLTAAGDGQGNGQIDLRADCVGLVDGTYTGQVLVSDGTGQLDLVRVTVIKGAAAPRSWQRIGEAALLAATLGIVFGGMALLTYRRIRRSRPVP